MRRRRRRRRRSAARCPTWPPSRSRRSSCRNSGRRSERWPTSTRSAWCSTNSSPERLPTFPIPRSLPPQAMRDLLDRRRRHVDRRPPSTIRGFPTRLRRSSRSACVWIRRTVTPALGRSPVDLENFLQRQPLIHASNPVPARTAGRLERFAIVVVLAANVFYLVILAMLSPLIVQQVAQWLQPAFKERPEFRQAVAAVDDHEYNRAVELLSKLVEEYPRAPLARASTSASRWLPRHPASLTIRLDFYVRAPWTCPAPKPSCGRGLR